MRTRILAAMALAVSVAVGCNPGSTSVAKPKGVAKAKANGDKHGDHEPGPHGGTIFDLGKHHAEFVVDLAKQEATLYIFGDDEKTSEPVTADVVQMTLKSPPVTVEFKSSPQSIDPPGKTSRFVGKHEAFGKKQPLKGTVTGVVDGKPSEGEFHVDSGSPQSHKGMPKGVGGTPAERDLFLTAGGIYTDADIKANGSILPSKKFAASVGRTTTI